MAARRPVNRRHVVERCRRPGTIWWCLVEDRGDERRAEIEVIRSLVDDRAVQPDDPLSALLDLRALRRVRRIKMMRLEVAVNECR
jgi:hypothetical protein